MKSAKDLDGARVCIQAGTTTEQNLADYFRFNKMSFTPKPYDTSVQTREGFEQGACDVLTSDKSQLAAIRSELSDPSSATVLPETISKEPLGPVVRQGDDAWFNTVKWVLFAMMNAEEMGVNSKNVDSKMSSSDPNILRMLGKEDNLCKKVFCQVERRLLLSSHQTSWQLRRSYEANVGADTPLGLTREGSPNALWSRGGLIYAPPIR